MIVNDLLNVDEKVLEEIRAEELEANGTVQPSEKLSPRMLAELQKSVIAAKESGMTQSDFVFIFCRRFPRHPNPNFRHLVRQQASSLWKVFA